MRVVVWVGHLVGEWSSKIVKHLSPEHVHVHVCLDTFDGEFINYECLQDTG